MQRGAASERSRFAMSDQPDQWMRLLDGIRKGDQETLRDFWEAYGPLLYRLADKHLEGGIRRRVEPEVGASSWRPC